MKNFWLKKMRQRFMLSRRGEKAAAVPNGYGGFSYGPDRPQLYIRGRSMEQAEKKTSSISVRNLVEFILRSGDLDNRRLSGAQKDAMLAGGRIHRKIQKRMGSRVSGGGFSATSGDGA